MIQGSFVALGDSMSCGLPGGATPWPRLVADVLDVTGGPSPLELLAQVGAMAADVERSQLPTALSLMPSLVTLAFGANDVLLRFQRDVDYCGATLERVVRALRCQMPRTRLIVLTYARFPPHLPYRHRSAARIRTGMSAVNECLRIVSRSAGVGLVDIEQEPVSRLPENFIEDGVHATAIGHARIAATVLNAVTGTAATMPDMAGVRRIR